MLEEEKGSWAATRPEHYLLIAVLVACCVLAARAPLPGPLKVWASFLVVFVLPGAAAAFSSLLAGFDVWDRLAASFLASLVAVTGLSLLSLAFGWGLSGVVWGTPCAAAALGLGAAARRARRGRGPREGGGAREKTATAGRTAGGARRLLPGLVLLAAAILLASALDGEMGPGTDAFDHLATVREIRDSGELLPLTTSYKYPEAPLPDPRKGFFHVGLAAMCVYSGSDPVVVWRELPVVLLPLALIVVFCLGRTLLGSAAGGLLAAALWLACFGGGGSRLPVQLGYAHNASEIGTWVLVALLVKYAAGGRDRLALFSTAGLGALCFVHISSIVLALSAWGFFLAAALVLGGPERRRVSLRLVRAGLLWLLVGVPAATVKMLMSYAPANPIQLQKQNLLYFTDSLYVVNPMWVFAWLGLPGALALVLAARSVLRRECRGPGALYVAGAALGPVLIVLNPLAVPALYSVVGYLVERLTWVVPYPYVLAGFLLQVPAAVRSSGRGQAGLRSALCVILAVAVAGAVARTAQSRLPGKRERGISYESWQPALAYLREEVREPSVVASDMLTSYSIPAFTKHHVVSTLHQHGSPNDPRGLDRLLALQDIMNPYPDPPTLRRRLLEWEVDYILVNTTFGRRYRLYFTELDPASLARLDAYLASRGSLFPLVFEAQGLRLYAVDREAVRCWDPPDRPRPPFLLGPDEEPPGETVGAVFCDQVELVSVELDRNRVERGRKLEITCYWRKAAEGISYEMPWTVQVRIQRDFPKGRLYSPAYGKVYRKAIELLRGERYRWRQSHLPAAGAIPPPRWGSWIVKDEVAFRVPPWMKPGVYEVTVSIGPESVYPNFALKDFLSDDDRYSGVTVGEVVVE